MVHFFLKKRKKKKRKKEKKKKVRLQSDGDTTLRPRLLLERRTQSEPLSDP
jgi:hypothetical protein